DPACKVNCTVPPAMLSFGVSTWGPWRTAANNAEFDIYLDGNGDSKPDAVMYNYRLTTTDDYDYFVSTTVNLTNGSVIDQELTNVTDGSFETGLFNSDSLVMPVSLYSLVQAKVIKPGASVGYQVIGFSSETGLADGDVAATAPWKHVDVASPGLQVTGDSGLATLNTDAPRQVLSVTRNPRTAAVDKPLGLLLLHHLNGTGDRAQVVRVR
ncbi:MAG: in family peptidase, partial [Marmoricola sp.]|nr:in family peptidase [Marmoricola sp.]